MSEEEIEKKADEALDKRMGTICYIKRDNVQIPYTDGYKDGYLAGAKENGIQWHDLRKDPNDLPQKVEDERQISDTVWIHIDNWGTEEGYYDYSLKSWIVRCRIVNLDVIAWCEIPQFKEQ